MRLRNWDRSNSRSWAVGSLTNEPQALTMESDFERNTMSMVYDIPVIMSVEADNIEEARQLAYAAVEDKGVMHETLATGGVVLTMADDSATNRIGQRLVILHPEDCASNYDADAYIAALSIDQE